ncbi:hypothetical protein ACVOZ6_003466 [Escherichia coli]
MIFKWQYADTPGMGKSDVLMMGDVSVGEVYQSINKNWRAICTLPDSGERDAGNFMRDYHCKGAAMGGLEAACARWLSKSGMWTLFGEGDTLRPIKTEQG